MQFPQNQLTKPRARPMPGGQWRVSCDVTGVSVFSVGFDNTLRFYYEAVVAEQIDRQGWTK